MLMLVCQARPAELTLALGGFAGARPELRGLVKGMDMADSLTLDG